MTPFITIKTSTGLDFQEDVESFTYEDCLEEDNLLTFEVFNINLKKYINEGKLDAGTVISFVFGYAKGKISNIHTAVLSDLRFNYISNTVIIDALDLGPALRRNDNIKMWGNKTSSGIVLEMAENYAMQSVIKETTKKWLTKSLPQAGLSDYQFIRELAIKEKNIIFYIRGLTMFFVERGIYKDSEITYSYPGDEDILDFKSKMTSTLADLGMDASNIIMNDYDSETDEIIETKIDDNIESNDTGNFGNEYMSNLLGIKQYLISPENKEQSKKLSEYLIREGRLELYKSDLSVEGNPLLCPDSVITMKGDILKRDVGNWYVNKITHSISNSGYKSDLELSKNATDQMKNKNKSNGNTKSKNTINLTEGEPNNLKKKKKIVNVYDKNGVKIGQTVDGVYEEGCGLEANTALKGIQKINLSKLKKV